MSDDNDDDPPYQINLSRIGFANQAKPIAEQGFFFFLSIRFGSHPSRRERGDLLTRLSILTQVELHILKVVLFYPLP